MFCTPKRRSVQTFGHKLNDESSGNSPSFSTITFVVERSKIIYAVQITTVHTHVATFVVCGVLDRCARLDVLLHQNVKSC